MIGSTLEKQFQIELDEPSKKIFSLFSEPITISTAVEKMSGELEPDEIYDIINFAITETIIVQDFEEKRLGKAEYEPLYDRQIRLFEEVSPGLGFDAQRKLTNSRIALLGIGGIGSYTLYTLAAMGVGFVRAVDFDEVQLSNLSRQIIYNRDDVGKLKIDCAKERIAKLNPNLQYEYIDKQIENEEDIISLISDCDFCLVAIDTPRKMIKMIVNNACLKTSVPYISAGSTVDSICIGPLVIPGETKDLSHIKEDTEITEDNFTESFNKSFVSTLIDPYNALAASYAALECVKYITNFSEPTLKNKIMIVNLNNYETTMAEI